MVLFKIFRLVLGYYPLRVLARAKLDSGEPMENLTSPPPSKLAIVSSIVALAISAATLIFIPTALRSIFSTAFLPHSYCYRFDNQLITLHVGSDVAIWLSYLAISCTLVYLVWRTRREIPFSWMFLAFGLFIVACGFTHFMEVIVLWNPLYWLAGDVKLITAVASVVTAIALPGLVPQIHAMVTSANISEDRRVQLEKANQELQQISAGIISVQDGERRRIARELHDGVGQYLVAIKMSCDAALNSSKREDSTDALREAIGLLESCTSEVRTMSHLLHPPLLEEIGLISAVPWYVEGFAKRSGIEVNLAMPPELDRLPQPVEITLFRVLQECLTNIHRHSESNSAKVAITIAPERVTLRIEDSGKGIAAAGGQLAKSGVGLASMRERVRELGGELKITSSSSGTVVMTIIPLKA
jgi:signal transduction histidine kinase